jgi:AraC-like DNA-binding protein
MDLHTVQGVTAKEVAEAHAKDVNIQDEYCCKAITYWLDEDKGCVFCLIEAPDKESVRAMHANAHGLSPNEIIEVNTDVVKGFLGRITDPETSNPDPVTNLNVFNDSAFRILLVTKTTDPRLLQHNLGKERTQELLLLYGTLVREKCRQHDGREVYLKEDGFVFSFVSALQAIECAFEIQKALQNSAAHIGLQQALHGGVPVTKSDAIFGSAIQFARFLCTISKESQVMLSSVVRERFKTNDWNLVVGSDRVRSFTTPEETFLEKLIDTLSAHWYNPEVDIPDFCRFMSMSKPQFYRKSIALTGMSPNSLLREYRLLQSLEYLRNEDRNIAQTTFDTGFSSPSYFTKCFQKRFGIQPLAYLKAR